MTREFIDFQTGWKIIETVETVNGSPSQVLVAVYSSDGTTKLTKEERARRLPATEIIEYPEHALTVKRVRTIDMETGQEYIEEQLIETSRQTLLRKSTKVAFYAQDSTSFDSLNKDIAQNYLESQEQEAAFWEQIHSFSQQEKIAYWTHAFYRERRWQGESGLEEDSIFTPEAYSQLVAKDPDFEFFFEDVLKEIAKLDRLNEARYLKKIRAQIDA